MDPILAQKTQELYAKLSRIRAAGKDVTEADIEAWMRRETGGKYGLADAQQYVGMLGRGELEGEDFGARGRGLNKNNLNALGQGASLNLADEAAGIVSPDARDAMRLRDKAFSSAHPYKSGGLKLAGAVLSPALLAALAPEGLVGAGATGTAMLGRAALAGAAGAGTAAMGASEAPDLGGRLKDAAWPAAAGAVLGPVASLATKGAGALARGAYRGVTESADGAAVRNSALLIPPGIQQQAARHEMLAPGSFIPAAASQEASAMGRGVGASPRAGLKAIETLRTKWAEIREAKKALKADYNALGKTTGPLKFDDDLRDILHLVGEDDAYSRTVGFEQLQRLRTKFREKAASSNKSAEQQKFNEARERLTAWLEPRVKGLSELDSRYSFLSRSEENIETAYNVVAGSNKTHGATSLYGGDASNTAGGNFPTNRQSMARSIWHKMGLNKAGRAEAAERMLLTPADGAQVARLAAAREAAMAPRAPTPGSNFVAPFGGSSAIMTLLKMLSEPLPDQMEQQDGAQ